MKKIFLIAVVLLMMINFIINYHHEVTKEQHTPMADFKTKVVAFKAISMPRLTKYSSSLTTT